MDKRWPAHNATTGELVGYHVRKDRPDGTKDKMYWEDISGNPGLNGFPTKDLSLYPYPIEPAGEIVVVEGEKCADALRDKGIKAAGTVLGGVAFLGGKGTMRGAICGSLLLSVMINVMFFLGFPPVAQYVAQGLIIVGAVAIPQLTSQWRAKP